MGRHGDADGRQLGKLVLERSATSATRFLVEQRAAVVPSGSGPIQRTRGPGCLRPSCSQRLADHVRILLHAAIRRVGRYPAARHGSPARHLGATNLVLPSSCRLRAPEFHDAENPTSGVGRPLSDSQLHRTRTAAYCPPGSLLHRVAVRAGELQGRKAAVTSAGSSPLPFPSRAHRSACRGNESPASSVL